MRVVVVTGGGGFIGSHVAERFVSEGWHVVVVDDFRSSTPDNLSGIDPERISVVVADVADGLDAPLARAEAQWGVPERVVHLAAQVSAPASLEDPVEDARCNLGATWHALEYARRVGATSFVLASSAAVYGDAPPVPTTETDPLAPRTPYGVHKRASELALGSAREVHGLGATALRFFNVYGPRQDRYSRYAGVVAAFIESARTGAPLCVDGDGAQTRDFIYVTDVADAVWRASANPSAAALNIGSGQEISVLDLATRIRSLSSHPLEITHRTGRSGDVARSCSDPGRAAELLDWTAMVSIEEGLRQTLEWMDSK